MFGKAYLLKEWSKSSNLWYAKTQVYRVDPFVTVNCGALCASPYVIVGFTPNAKVWVPPVLNEEEDDYDFDPMFGFSGISGGYWESSGKSETTVFAGFHTLTGILKGKTFRGMNLEDAELLLPSQRVVGSHDPAAALGRLEGGYEIIPSPVPDDLPKFDAQEFVYFY